MSAGNRASKPSANGSKPFGGYPPSADPKARPRNPSRYVAASTTQTSVRREEKRSNNGYASNSSKYYEAKKTNHTAGVSTNNQSNQDQSKDPNSSNNENEVFSFPEYMSEQDIQQVLSSQNRENVEYVKGNIQIDPKDFKKAYITMAKGEDTLFIKGVLARNRALDGDFVVAKVNPREKWPEFPLGHLQRTGIVVRILKKIHSRKTVGDLKLKQDENNQSAVFTSRDSKFPRLNIPCDICPENFFENPKLFAGVMFLVELTDWTDVRYANGKILECVGKAGDLKAEKRAILFENNLDVTPYGEELTEGLPSSDYVPTDADTEGREDWRKECIFTIDPKTAKDLDDAVSCKVLENGNYEVGVHISDVTHYLKEFSPLDKEVSKRGSSIYMVDYVHHMLPINLCNACSLLPGVDKLAFSVVWEMTPKAKVVSQRFVKTIINSCCQMSYEHVQGMIMEPDKLWSAEDLPSIKGNYESSDLSRMVYILNNLAVQMREQRIANGTSSGIQQELEFVIDEESGLPSSYTLEERKDSNRLIEEFMLLANISVANHLYSTYPEFSLLKCHHPNQKHILSKIQPTLEKLEVHLDTSSAKSLHDSLRRYEPDANENDAERQFGARCRMMAIEALCAKSMDRAKYFCSGDKEEDAHIHYGLNIPRYTHFTSPIRRYADCVVHRLLSASIRNESPSPQWTPELCSKIAANCNEQMYKSKKAEDRSDELYLSTLLNEKGPYIMDAVVINVSKRKAEVKLCDIHRSIQVFFAEVGDDADAEYSDTNDLRTITLSWKQPVFTQVIQTFSTLRVKVSKRRKNYGLHGLIVHPSLETPSE